MRSTSTAGHCRITRSSIGREISRRKFGGDPDHPFDEKDIERAVVAALKEK